MVNIGTHVSSSKSIDLVFDRGLEVGANSIQFFLRSPRTWAWIDRSSTEKDLFIKKSRESGIFPTVAHASYLFNLASDDDDLFNRSIHSVIEELLLCEELNIDYYVIHAGKTKGRSKEEGIKRILQAFDTIFKKVDLKHCWFLVETLAGQRGEVGQTTQEIRDMILPYKDINIGVCIDTCHLFAAGYSINKKEGLESYKREFDSLIGLDRIKVIHCNDSKAPFNSKKDRHEHIGEGYIGLDGFEVIINDSFFRKLPFILETPKEGDMDIVNIKRLRSLEHP